MTRLPDISAYYTPQLALQEEVHCILERAWLKPFEFIAPRLADHGVKKIVEFGCRSGLLASKLPSDRGYTGIDTNQWFLDKARDRCDKKRQFQFWDCRNWNKPREPGTLAMAWGVLKHYSLDEWDKILINLLNAGQYAAFNVQIVDDEPFDNGKDYHHIFVTETRLQNVLRAAGHIVEKGEVLTEWEVDGKKARDVAYWTEFKVDGNLIEDKWEKPAPILADLQNIEKTLAGECVKPSVRFMEAIEEVVKDRPAGDVYSLDNHSLEIDGAPQTLLHRFALRFVETDTGHDPVLYMDGRRVTKAWRLKMDWRQEADPHGDNANTAETTP